MNTPHYPEVEEKALKLLMVYGKTIHDQYEQPRTDYFYDAQAREVYSIIEQQLNTTGDCCYSVVKDIAYQKSTDLGEYVDGIQKKHIHEFEPEKFPNYLHSLKNATVGRQIQALALDLRRLSVKSDIDYTEKMKEAYSAIDGHFNIPHIGSYRTGTEIVDKIYSETMQLEGLSLDERKQKKGISTGFSNLDHFFLFGKDDYVLLAANPNMGKTTLALNFLVSAVRQGKHVVLISAEMSGEAVMTKVMDILSGKNIKELPYEQEDFFEDLTFALHRAHRIDKQIHVLDEKPISPQTIADFVKRKKIEGQCDFVIIDYLDELDPAQEKKMKHEEVSQTSRAIKNIAKNYEVPVLMLSQLNRSNVKIQKEGEKMRRPIPSDLMNSSQLEAQADVILMLYSKEYLEQTTDKTIEVLVRKNRLGQKGTANLNFHTDKSLFTVHEQQKFGAINDDDEHIDKLNLPSISIV